MYNTRRSRRSMVNGRVVDLDADTQQFVGRSSYRSRQFGVAWKSFSLIRLVILTTVVVALIATNPLNHVSRDDYKRMYARKWTNYGIFAIQEGFNKVTLVAGTKRLECPFFPTNDHGTEPDIDLGWICRVIRDHLSHQKGLLSHPNDRPHTTHRIITLILIISTILGSCFRSSRNGTSSIHPWSQIFLNSQNLFFESIFSIFIFSYEHDSIPLLDLPWMLLQCSATLYPAWQRLDYLVPLQRHDSLFRLVSEKGSGATRRSSRSVDNMNYVWSFIWFLFLAAAVRALSLRLWNTPYLLSGWQALLAMSLGYVYTIDSSLAVIDPDWYGGPSQRQLAWTTTVLILTMTFCRRPMIGQAIVMWLLALIVGSCVGQYQVDHMDHVAAAFNDLTNGFRDAWNWLSTRF